MRLSRLLRPFPDVRRAVNARYGRLKATAYPPDASCVKEPTRAVIEQFAFVDAQARKERQWKAGDEAPESTAGN
jgi:hypothetical protein